MMLVSLLTVRVVGGELNDVSLSPHASLLYCMSARDGSEVPMVLLAVLTVLFSCSLSSAVLLPDQEVKRYVRMLSVVPL